MSGDCSPALQACCTKENHAYGSNAEIVAEPGSSNKISGVNVHDEEVAGLGVKDDPEELARVTHLNQQMEELQGKIDAAKARLVGQPASPRHKGRSASSLSYDAAPACLNNNQEGKDIRASKKDMIERSQALAPAGQRATTSDAEAEQFLREEQDNMGESGPKSGMSQVFHRFKLQAAERGANVSVLLGSAMKLSAVAQIAMYTVAFALIIFVLVAKAMDLGGENCCTIGGASSASVASLASVASASASSSASGASASSSASAGECVAPAGSAASSAAPLDDTVQVLQLAFCLLSAGLLAFIINLLKQPLILGYLLSGVLVGPLSLDIVHAYAEIADVSSLGLVFLLFMIGLELDVMELLKMGKVVIVTGLMQFPTCAVVHICIFTALAAIGLDFGCGMATIYVGATCAISSTMIVAKLLAEAAEMDSAPGRLTIGILIFQDIWAIIVLAVQPSLDDIQILPLALTFGKIILLIIIALTYAKFVMPAVFLWASTSIELMLILALAWCFFLCCLATLPFMGLSMELAALIAGAALATFPYSAEFNGKIKYIRDFFITLFFVGLGMQIPAPDIETIVLALLVAAVVYVVRWIGIFSIVALLSLGAKGGFRLAAVATINLSQISEFALVICTLGQALGHIGQKNADNLNMDICSSCHCIFVSHWVQLHHFWIP
jgi:Kef-type K+ transport system membrane component KefB